MNRRNFLKRAAAIVAGSIAISTIAKQLPFKLNPAQKEIINLPLKEIGRRGRHVTLTMWDEFAKYPVGTLYRDASGRVYRYVKSNKFVKVGDYANCPRCKRVDLHDHTRCTGRT